MQFVPVAIIDMDRVENLSARHLDSHHALQYLYGQEIGASTSASVVEHNGVLHYRFELDLPADGGKKLTHYSP